MFFQGTFDSKITNRLSLQVSQVAQTPEAYPGFFHMKQLQELLLPPGWDASLLEATLL